MLRQLTYPQLMEWMKYEEFEPFDRDRWHAASICATFANMMVAVHGGRKRFRVKDFLLEFGELKDVKEGHTPRQSVENMKFIARQMVALANVEEKAKKHKRR